MLGASDYVSGGIVNNCVPAIEDAERASFFELEDEAIVALALGDEKMVFTEDYTEIKIGVKLDPGTFDPKQFNATHWEK